MGNKLTKFEESIQNALEGYEVPYDEGSWEKLNQKLNAAQTGNSHVLSIAALVGAVVLGGAAWYYLSSAEASQGQIASLSRKVSEHSTYGSITQKIKAHKELTTWEEATQEHAEALTPSTNQSELPAPSTTSSVDSSQLNEIADEQGANASSSAQPISENSANLSEPSQTFPENQPINDKEEVSFGISTRVACVGTSVEFSIENQDVNGNYLWNFGDGNFSNQPNPTHTYYKPGAYDITLSVTSSNDGVIRTKTIDNMIVVNPSPEADFEWEFIDSNTQKPTVQIINKSTRAESCKWVIDDADENSEINPSVEFNTKGEHVVHLQVSNEFGCVDHRYKYINVDKDYKLMAPEKISPNGDGAFDTFMPKALYHMNKPFKLTVYDQNEVIFESTDAANAWDGSLPNGLLAPVGSEFPWIVILYNEFGEEEFYSGTITIAP